MENKKSLNLLNNNGQSTIEYILLLVVVMSLISVVVKSPLLKPWMGGNGGLYKSMARSIEFSYRYGHNGTNDDYSNNYSDIRLKSYKSETGNSSRFFSPELKYAE